MEEKRPKRLKSKDNPYTLHVYENRYTVEFKDGLNVKQEIDIEEIVHSRMNKFELEDKSYMNKVTNHIEQSELTEEQLAQRVLVKPISIDEIILKEEQNKELRKAIDSLPKPQRGRIIKKFFYEMTFEEISKEEKVNIRTIQSSLNRAIKNLRKKLAKFYEN